MTKNRLDELGSDGFEELTQTLLKARLGLGVEAWGGRGDWGRDAYFRGKLRYPTNEEKEGTFVFQAKFVEGANAAGAKPRKAISDAVRAECAMIKRRLEEATWEVTPTSYTLITNAPLSPELRDSLCEAIRTVLPTSDCRLHDGHDVCQWLRLSPEVADGFPALRAERRPRLLVALIIVAVLLLISVLAIVVSNQGQLKSLLADLQQRSTSAGHIITPEERMAYREIVARIYGDLQADSKIRLQDTVTSKSNNISHTFDLTIRATQAGQEVLTVVNVYPGVAPVDEEGVSIFAKSLEDVGAAKGVMICNGGFTQSAKSLAPSLGIELSSVQDAQSRNWREDIKIPVLRIDRDVYLNFSLQVHLDAGAVVSKSMSGWQFTQDEGKTVFNIVGLFTNLWNNKLIPIPEDKPQQVALDEERLKVWIGNANGSGVWTNATGLRLVYQYREIGGWLKYFTPTEYLAVKDQLSENIQVTRLNVQLGPFVPDKTWTKIKNPDALKRRTKGVLAVVKPMLEQIGGGTDEFFDMRAIEPPTNSAPR